MIFVSKNRRHDWGVAGDLLPAQGIYSTRPPSMFRMNGSFSKRGEVSVKGKNRRGKLVDKRAYASRLRKGTVRRDTA